MTLYQATAYNPKIVGATTFTFDDGTTRVNITGLSVKGGTRSDIYEIPGKNGKVIVGADKDNLSISMSLQIATDDLETFNETKMDLQAALAGDDEGKFTFFLRYEDASNYWKYGNCVLQSIEFNEGPQDPCNPELNVNVSLEIVSQDCEPSIMVSGTLVQGDGNETFFFESLDGSTAIIISDAFIIQDTLGDIQFNLDALIPRIDYNGEITQSGSCADTTTATSFDNLIQADTVLIAGALVVTNAARTELIRIDGTLPKYTVTGEVQETL